MLYLQIQININYNTHIIYNEIKEKIKLVTLTKML